MEACRLTCLADFGGVDHRHVGGLLSDMAVDGNVSALTQNVAFHAQLKLWTLVLMRPLGQIDAIRAVKDRPVPAVLAVVDRDGVGGGPVSGETGYLGPEGRSRFWRNGLRGSRIGEAMRLRVKDIDFAGGWIDV